MLLVMGLLLEVAAGGTCTGASKGLAADQCAAWGKFWDGAGGPNWTGGGQGCTKSDPCGCCPLGPSSGCDVVCGTGYLDDDGAVSGSTITEM
jgi:hypothetical protein